MAVSIPDFWNLLIASRVVSRNSVPRLQDQFSQAKGAEQGNVVTLAQWLISHGVISRYQAKVLLAGHAGPFAYGDYNVYDRHAEGPLAGAFRAIHPATRHRVLLWFHSGAAVQNPQWWAIVVQQAGIFRQAVHPNVGRLYHLADLGQFKFTVMEDLQGETAQQRLEKGPLPWAVACRMVRQAALGLTKLFELGQLHGAIRPSNLWIDEQDNVKLMLPPLARDLLAVPGPIDLNASSPNDPQVLEADYLAPELAQPGQMPGGRTEIYALGCTLFHLLTGRPPFKGTDLLSKLSSHAAQQIPPLDSAVAPQLVNQVLAVMMAKDPQRRYQNARQTVEVLTKLLEKLDPEQLQWPASTTSNKLPEYEAWLAPYGLAPASQTNDAPDIAMPPILAAGLQPRPQRQPEIVFPGMEPQGGSGFFAQPQPGGHQPTQQPPPPSRPGPPPLPKSRPDSAGPQMSSGSSIATTPPITKVTPTIATSRTATKPHVDEHSPTVAVMDAPVKAAATNGHVAASEATRTQITGPAAASSRMIFPPEDDDFIGAITGKRPRPASKQPTAETPHSRKRFILIGAIVAGCAIVAAILWITMHGKSSGPAETAAQDAAPAETSATTSGQHSDSSPNSGGNGAEVNPPSGSQNPPSADADPTNVAPAASADDGSTLWASPTQGSPLSLVYLPPGVQAILVLRPADLMRQADAEKITAALGPDAQASIHSLESLVGASLADIDQLTVAWTQLPLPGGGWTTQPMYVIRLAKLPEKQTEQTPDNQPAASSEAASEKPLTIYAPPKEDGKLLVVGPPEMIAEVTKLAGQPPPISRDLEKLLLTTDDQRLVTLLWCPSSNAIVNSVDPSGGKWNELLSAAQSFFGNDARAAAISASLSADDLFLELRVRGTLDQPTETVAKHFQQRLNRLPGMLKNYLAGLKLQPYGKEILNRFPQMIQVLNQFTRAGSDGDQTVLRCYLPTPAAHNLLLASELTLSEAASAGANSGQSGGGEKPPQSIADKLKRKTTLSFVNEPLDKTMSLLADDLGIKIEILGPDLQLDGITKNQAIRDLNEQDKPAAEILRNIMLKANPDGKLVYVVKPRAPGGEEMLFITTRAAAKKRGDKLPDDLATPPEKK